MGRPYRVNVPTRVHHLNCATMRTPLAGRSSLVPSHLVAHCLLVETADRLVLVDTAFGTADLASPAKRLGRPFLIATGPTFDPAETAVAQVRGLGHRPEDVTDIVVTHLDLDHAGGLGDFPGARVHVLASELAAARARKSQGEKGRYRPVQWEHGPSWVEHDTAEEDWFGFAATPVWPGSDDLVLVPLIGHTRGHVGVGVRRPGGGWFLHAGDAYFSHGEKLDPPQCPGGLKVFQSMVQMDKAARLANQDRLRSLHAEHGAPGPDGRPEITMFCAHDHVEYDALADVTD